MAVGGPKTGFKLITDTVFGWGNAQSGTQGLGYNEGFPQPTAPLIPSRGAIKVSTGGRHGLVLGTDKNIYAAGPNDNGGFGNNTTTASARFVQVTSDNRWVDIAAGYFCSLAIRDDNTLWATGQNNSGQLGLNDTTDRSSWTQVGSLTNWSKVVSSKRNYLTSFALKTDGTLWGWGTGMYPNTSSPVLIGGTDTWKEISQSDPFLAIRSDGTLWAMGRNDSYQIGNGTNVFSSSLIQIGSANDWLKIAAGQDHCAGIKTDGTVWVWGRNTYGELGLGTNSNNVSTPVQLGTDTNWYSVECFDSNGEGATFLIKNDGTLWATGANSNNSLGNGGGNVSSPVQIGSLTTWKQVSAAYVYSMGIATITQDLGDRYVSKDYLLDNYANLVPGLSSPGLYACGYNSLGVLGLGDTTDRSSPTQIGTLTNWKQVSEGGTSTLAIKKDGSLWGWGNDGYGQLGTGDTTSRSSPVQIGLATYWKQISVGNNYAGAIQNDGTLWTWGGNSYGQLGSGTTTNRSSPVQIGALTTWKQIICSSVTAAATKTDGTLWTWGYNGNGELGLGDLTNRSSPTQVGTLQNWDKIATKNNSFMVAIKTDGTLWAWGANTQGQLGNGTTTNYSSPIQIGSQSNWKEISCNSNFSAAIKMDGTLWTWGANDYGQLGSGTTTYRSSPVQVGTLTNWKKISCGNQYMLALKTDGTLWAWGVNFNGCLGNGTLTNYSSPIQIGSLTTWKYIYAGSSISMTIKDGYI